MPKFITELKFFLSSLFAARGPQNDYTYPIRLVTNGTITTPNEGTVEILHNGTWSAICDDYWGYSEAVVACHMLGFATAVRAYIRLVNFSKPLEICTELVYSKPLKFLVNYWKLLSKP